MTREKHRLRLYVAGASAAAQAQIRELLDAGDYPPYELEVVDILERPDLAEQGRVLATPTLIRVRPEPQRRIVGSLEAAQLTLLLGGGDGDGRPSGPSPRPTESDGEFLDRVGHEMQNSVSVIRGFAATMLEMVDTLDRDALRKGIEAIVRSGTNLQVLVESLRVGHVLDSGEVRLQIVRVNLADFVVEAVRDLELLMRPHPVTVATDEDVMVEVDTVRIRQILNNLLSNAAKFSDPDAPVHVVVSAVDGRAEVEVVDKGRGIPPERKHELFGQYARLGAEERGTGLGLYVSRALARAHGGDLTAESDGKTGSTFRLSLPLARKGA